MAGCCGGCQIDPPAPDAERGSGGGDRAWRRALWIALAINAGMFAVEIVAGVTSGSAALKADALDFVGDAANYAVSLWVAGMALVWRARTALLKGATLLALALWVIVSTGWTALAGGVPEPVTMGTVGVMALVANITAALILYRYRGGDANRRSVWICSRNDAIGNVAVAAAAAGVFGTGSAWPDLVVAGVLASLGIAGGWQIVRHALAELRSVGRLPVLGGIGAR